MFDLLLGQLICRGRGNSKVSCYLTTKVYKNHFRCEFQCALCNEFEKCDLVLQSIFQRVRYTHCEECIFL